MNSTLEGKFFAFFAMNSPLKKKLNEFGDGELKNGDLGQPELTINSVVKHFVYFRIHCKFS